LTIELREETRRGDIHLEKGDVFVASRGMKYRSCGEAKLMLIGNVGILNIGNEKVKERTRGLLTLQSRCFNFDTVLFVKIDWIESIV
jgi:hypothetical protein